MEGRVARKMEASLLKRKVVLDLVRDLSQALYGFALVKLSYMLSIGRSRDSQGHGPKGLETEFWTQDVTVGTQPKLRAKPHPLVAIPPNWLKFIKVIFKGEFYMKVIMLS